MKLLSQVGLDFIKSQEGCRLTAYKDSGGKFTIGYGHTENVKPGSSISQEEAEELLLKDIRRREIAVNSLVTIPITQNMFDALVSFCFNVGIGALKTSTLLIKLNSNEIVAAADQFLVWDYNHGTQDLVLNRRRRAERRLFLS